MTTWERISDLMNEKGIIQKDLADYLGTRPQTITDWKNGKTKSYQKFLPQIATFLGVSVDYLSGKDRDPESELSLPAAFETRADIRERLSKLSPKDVDDLLPFLDYLIGRHNADNS